jgi:peptidoglycan/LPS O-acetylase OafA/YrhL
LYFHSLSAVLDLAIGGITAWLCLFNERFREFFASLANPSRILLLIGGISIMYLVAMPGNGVVKVLLTFLQAVFFALIITDQCFNKNTALKMSSNKLFTSLGKYTYGMYMLHPLVLLALNTISVRVLHWNISGTRAVSTAAIAGLLLTYLLARLSYHLFEKRFLRLKGIYATAKNNYPLPAGRIDADPNKTN